MNASDLIDVVLEGYDPSDVVDCCVEDAVDEERQRGTARKPRVQRYAGRGPKVNPVTGKRKDPQRSRLMKRIAKRGSVQAKKGRALKRFARTGAGKQLHKKLGKKKLVH